MTTADAVFVVPRGVLEGVAELAQVGVGGEHPVGAEGGREGVDRARESAASVTPGGSGLRRDGVGLAHDPLLFSGNLI